MGREIEIKLRVANLAELQRKLRRLGATVRVRRVHEWNELFDTPRNDLKRREQLLRIRTETRGGSHTKGHKSDQSAILTFKGPLTPAKRQNRRSEPYKVREEIELEVSNQEALEGILHGLGMRVWFRYEKCRTTYRLPKSAGWAQKLLIELDETPIGLFLELEGPGQAIDRVAKALGYSRQGYITANYFVLYRQECRRAGKKVGDMLFGKRRR